MATLKCEAPIQQGCEHCSVSMDRCNYSRRCFMTGEYCSKQQLIQKQRKKLHDNHKINAFVVMNFSSMSDVVYNWRIQDFVEELKSFLYFEVKHDKDSPKGAETSKGIVQKLCCFVDDSPFKKDASGEAVQQENHITYEPVESINVIRADSAYASNFVMCNRVCQQMQIADLIIVDVSVENANVFYELGMCMAMGKLILPMCYTNSYFARELPELIRNSNLALHDLSLQFPSSDSQKRILDKRRELQNHIGCYPWRKRLFEYYGIRYRNKPMGEKIDSLRERFPDIPPEIFLNFPDITGMNVPKYISFEDATNPAYGFEDIHYNAFPYSEAHVEDGAFGRKIYERLQKSFNLAGYLDNTLVIYTIDGFENKEQAGRCIVNYYKYMTAQMDRYACFCGDRVGTLVQENKIPEDPKDSRDRKSLIYNVSEAIHIGVNHATTTAFKAKINSPDCFHTNEQNTSEATHKDLAKYLQNQSMMIYPDRPVYVRRIRSGVQSDPLRFTNFCAIHKMERFYCLYHVMLRNLKFVRELVVDISNNSPQALFWLGMAHGADIYAITVKREETEAERSALRTESKQRDRNLFDVSGLWTAVFQTEHANAFYRQLSLAQMGVEYHSKLMSESVDDYYRKLLDPLNTMPFWDAGQKQQSPDKQPQETKEESKLESYYRSKLWKALRKQNRLWLYLRHEHNIAKLDDTKSSNTSTEKLNPTATSASQKDNEDPKVFIVKWDVNAAGRLSNYLSKRSPIGEYHIETLEDGKPDIQADSLSFISIGADTMPFVRKGKDQYSPDSTLPSETLVENINRQIIAQRSCLDLTKEDPQTLQPTLYQKTPAIRKPISDEHRNCPQVPSEACPENQPEQLCYQQGYHESRGFIQKDSYLGMSQNSPVTENRLTMQFPLTGKCINCPQNGTCFEIEQPKFEKKLNGKFGHVQLAQLVLWREIKDAAIDENLDAKDRDERQKVRDERKNYSDAYADEIYYRVALNGVSGPATEALTALLIDPDDSTDILRSEDLLCQLQMRIRKSFLDTYKTRTSKFAGNNTIYPWIEEYLLGILYQYALPFLSRSEERQILNGLKYYLRSHRDQMDFKTKMDKHLFNNHIDPYVRALRKLLWGFQGVEAFYEVTVSIAAKPKTDSTTDNRAIIGINPCPKSCIQKVPNTYPTETPQGNQNEEFIVNCIFL